MQANFIAINLWPTTQAMRSNALGMKRTYEFFKFKTYLKMSWWTVNSDVETKLAHDYLCVTRFNYALFTDTP